MSANAQVAADIRLNETANFVIALPGSLSFFRSEEHTSELQSPVHHPTLPPFPTRRSSDHWNASFWAGMPLRAQIATPADSRKHRKIRRRPTSCSPRNVRKCAGGGRYSSQRNREFRDSAARLALFLQIGRAHV